MRTARLAALIAAAAALPANVAPNGTVDEVLAAASLHDCAAVLAKAPGLLAPETAGSDPALLARADEFAASCAFEQGRRDDALRFAVAGTALSEASDRLWQLRLAVTPLAADPAAFVATIEAMADRHPAALDAIPPRVLGTVDDVLTVTRRDDLRGRLLAVLTGGRYAPQAPFTTIDRFLKEEGEQRVAAHDPAGAGAVLARVTDPDLLAGLLADPVTRTLVGPADALRARVEAELAREQEERRLAPNRLDGAADVAFLQIALGRPADSRETLATAGDPDRAADPEHLTLYWSAVAHMQFALNDDDAAADAFRRAAQYKPDGTRSVNVGQVLNLADAQLSRGHPADALATLAVFDTGTGSLNDHGAAFFHGIHGCARALGGDVSGAGADRAYLRDHRDAAAVDYARLLLCLNDDAGAAHELVRALGRADTRADVLEEFSDFDPPPLPPPAEPLVSRLKALRQRPDMSAALVKAGGTVRIPFQR